MNEHKCLKYNDIVAGKHDGYGDALWDTISRDGDTWFAGNGEYGTPVRFCPWCGIDLMTILAPEQKEN